MNWIIGALIGATFCSITARARRKQVQLEYARNARSGRFAADGAMDCEE